MRRSYKWIKEAVKKIEADFNRSADTHLIKDAASYAAIHFLARILGRKCGGSTGTNLYGAFQVMAKMHQQTRTGSVVSLICDHGERYLHTYYNEAWLQENGYHIEPYLAQLEHFYHTGEWLEELSG